MGQANRCFGGPSVAGNGNSAICRQFTVTRFATAHHSVRDLVPPYGLEQASWNYKTLFSGRGKFHQISTKASPDRWLQFAFHRPNNDNARFPLPDLGPIGLCILVSTSRFH